MVEYGKVRSTVRPEPIVIDDFSVWQHSNIQEVAENVGKDNEFVGYEYDMTQYSKDEFILKQEQQITNTQLALCEVYELLA